MDISANIKAIRTNKGISQAELSRRLELDPSSYHRLENRGDKLSVEQLQSIAQALDVTLLDILTWGEAKPESKNEVEMVKEVETLRDRVQDLQMMVDLQSEFSQMRKKYAIQQRDNYSSMLKKIEALKKDGEKVEPEIYLVEIMLETIAFMAGLKDEDL